MPAGEDARHARRAGRGQQVADPALGDLDLLEFPDHPVAFATVLPPGGPVSGTGPVAKIAVVVDGLSATIWDCERLDGAVCPTPFVTTDPAGSGRQLLATFGCVDFGSADQMTLIVLSGRTEVARLTLDAPAS